MILSIQAQCDAATERLHANINRSAAQHLRRMRETALPTTMDGPEPAEADADVIAVAARAVADAFSLSFEQAITRLADINDWTI